MLTRLETKLLRRTGSGNARTISEEGGVPPLRDQELGRNRSNIQTKLHIRRARPCSERTGRSMRNGSGRSNFPITVFEP